MMMMRVKKKGNRIGMCVAEEGGEGKRGNWGRGDHEE